MRCETCQGTGRVPRHPPELRAYGGAWLTEEKPCPECGGCGVSHCCDGLTACNDVLEPADPAVAAMLSIVT